LGTIAKVSGERKEKSQKRLEKCGFSCEAVEKTCINGGMRAFAQLERFKNGHCVRIRSI